MRKNTVITLVASVGFGVLAVTLARGWINDAVTAQQKKTESVASDPAYKPRKTTPVLLLNTDVKFGDRLTPDMVKLVDYPADFIPQGSFNQLSSLFEDEAQPITVLDRMNQNEPVLDFKITGKNSGASLASLIREGYRAVSVRVDAISGVGGFVMPEDRVDVIFVHDKDAEARDTNLVSNTLLQNIRVLGIDQNMRNTEKTPSVVRTVTLEVKQDEAQKLQLAMDAGKLSLTLRPAGETHIENTVLVTQSGLIDSGSSKIAHVNKATTTQKPSYTRSNNNALHGQVTIIRGETRDEVTVRREDVVTNTKMAGG